MKKNQVKKIVKGACFGAIGVIGLSAFTAKNSAAVSEGWYRENALAGETTSSPRTLTNFPNFLSTTKPLVGTGQPCATKSGFVCAAYFNTMGNHVIDPNSGVSIVTGTRTS